MSKLTRADAVASGNFKVPKARYQLRVLEPKFEISKDAGNPMIVLDCEILGHDGIGTVNDFDGTPCEVAGMKCTSRIMLTPKTLNQAFDLFDRLGNKVDEFDVENPDVTWLKGLVFDAIVSSSERVSYGADKKPILDADGKPITQGWQVNQIWPTDILGLSKPEYSQPVQKEVPY